MPTPDPGYQAFLNRQEPTATLPDITPTEHGYAWLVDGERHELFVPFGAVHVTKAIRS